jgi:two-component system, LytTR family, sensor kinase
MQKGLNLSKRAIIIYHILFWVLFLSYPFIIRKGMLDFERLDTYRNITFFEYKLLVINIYNIIAFYLIAFYFIPRYFKNRSLGRLFGGVILLFLGFLAVSYLLHQLLSNGSIPPSRFTFGFSFIFILLLSVAYSLISERIRIESRLQEMENEYLRSELQFLRSQISPHFMFNVLNNMVSMARKKSDQLENSLIQLSGLMRYMLYEVKNDKVPLNKEIDFLNIYIDLQQQRMKEEVVSNFYLETDPRQFYIEPMLLIPFVENAFKHSQSSINPEIEISVILTKAKLSLDVKNSYDTVNCNPKDNSGGIGLVNVKRRLELLYGNKYDLQIVKTNSTFQIQLHIGME